MDVLLDFSVPIVERIVHLHALSPEEVDNLLERLCSMYNIHPTFTVAQFLQHLILEPQLDIRRRIRVAETCDFGPTVLYLLTRIQEPQDRIGCIELFTQTALKVHAYTVLFTRAPIPLQVQIMKNFSTLVPECLTPTVVTWFVEQMRNDTLTYPVRTNCADFLLRYMHTPKEILTESRSFLRLLEEQTDDLYAHRENVHLFVPRMKALRRILSKPKSCSSEVVLQFVRDNGYNMHLFQQRILNDKTQLGTARESCTLEELLQRIWGSLTDNLRHLLLHDLESSVDEDEEWQCTTGYYNRILNIYQSVVTDEALFDASQDRDRFQRRFTETMNTALQQVEQTDALLDALSRSGEAARIQYLSFRVHSLPSVLEHMRAEFNHIPTEQLDEWIADGLRIYEA